MKISEMVRSYASNIHLKAKLKKKIKLDNGITLKKGTVSSILIKKDDDTYHFEAENTACVVTKEELEFI